MKLQNILDLSTFEITRFRIWNQTSQPSDKGLGSKYFNTNSGHEAYGREQIYTPIGWRTAAYMDDIEAINEKLDLIFGDEIDTDTIIDSWKEVQDFLAGIEDTTTLVTMLDGKLDKTGGTIESVYTYPLKIDYKGSSSYTAIVFYNNGTQWGGLGMKNDTPIFINAANDNIFNLIHSGNIKDYKAGGLAKAVTLWGQSFDGTKDITGSLHIDNGSSVFFRDSGGTLRSILYMASSDTIHVGYDARAADLNTAISGKNVYLYYGSGSQGFILNSSGNVGIGTTAPQYKLDVAGTGRFSQKLHANGGINSSGGSSYGYGFSSDPNNYGMTQNETSSGEYLVQIAGYAGIRLKTASKQAVYPSSANIYLGRADYRWLNIYGANGDFSGLVSLSGGALIPTGKNMMFGDASGNAIMEYDADANAIKVTGNFYATGTVASGGKAQEGTGTGGSATVYPFTLTYGQSAYQIANPKSNTNVIVQVYEWNATTSSWDLILTDVNVTASKITVTFGRTTTVNHMVTVV